ncbi:DUF4124 domain-containing protein [Maricurvus nonylphenolicus]|uniref:DUF4124 domain-containing protein n=1 Tax=Maricurvus nonylphenolicus TaxID=1008307 RepID=UPI0036F1DA48
MKIRVFVAALATSICLLASNSSHAAKEYYKWVDENGVTHYTAHPPGERKSTKVRTTNLKPSSSSTATAQPSTDNSGDKDTTAAPAPKEEAPKKDPALCKQAKENLKIMKENSRIKVKDGDDYRFLADDEIKKRKEEADKIVKDHC